MEVEQETSWQFHGVATHLPVLESLREDSGDELVTSLRLLQILDALEDIPARLLLAEPGERRFRVG